MAAQLPRPVVLSRRSVLQLGATTAAAAVTGVTRPGQAGATTRPAAELSAPLRAIDKPNLVVAADPAATITGPKHRVSFYLATWDGGRTYLRNIEVNVNGAWESVTATDHRFDEQWLYLTGSNGWPQNYYTTMTPHWLAFDQLTKTSSQTVQLSAGSNFTVQWSVAGRAPEVQFTLTAGAADNYVVGYQSFDIVDLAGVDEVLCGTRQHARAVLDMESLGAWELMAPMTMVQRTIDGQPFTLGLYIPAAMMEFEHLVELGASGQPYGMSLRNLELGIQPIAFAPQVGTRSALTAGQQLSYSFGICAQPSDLYSAYSDLSRNEYGYRDYRQNVYNTSLTQTMFNIIDLVMQEPAASADGSFVASPSGWWPRAKGFADVENNESVRTATTGVMLAAYYLTADQSIYDRRARPQMEYQLSRTGISWSPILGQSAPGNSAPNALGGIPGDAATLVPLYQQTRGQNAGIHALAMQLIKSRPPGGERTPMTVPLQAYELTGNPAYQAELRAQAQLYAQTWATYTTTVTDADFQYDYVRSWTDLLLAYERCGDADLLAAALREARRFITQMQVRPVPDTTVTVPDQPVELFQFDGWSPTEVIWAYPRQNEPSEQVPAWQIATNGLSFEQLTTLRGEGWTKNPCWAAFLLRLAAHTGDELIRDVAHNLVTGRYTNYPGYYYRQFEAWDMHPEYPLVGPPGVGDIYYTHMAAQLGMTMDYLFSEHITRSAGNIDFPAQFEVNYLFFKFQTYGHTPGTFYGESGVWPYLPKKVVTVSNAQLNWITAEGNGSLYLSLTNASTRCQTATINFDAVMAGIDPARAYNAEIIADNGTRRTARVTGGGISVTVSASGITAIIVRGVDLTVPLHHMPDATDRSAGSFHFDDASPVGIVRAIALTRPDRSGFDAYVQANTTSSATLKYSLDSGGTWQSVSAPYYPNEWTIPVPDLQTPFSYQVSAGTKQTTVATVQLSPAVTGAPPAGIAAYGEVDAPPDTTPGDSLTVAARLYNGSGAAWQNVAVTLNPPTGWTATPVGSPPVGVPAGGTATARFTVTSPATQAAGSVQLAGSATWSGGSVTLQPIAVTVLAPVQVFSFVATPAVLASPGDSSTVVMAVLNAGPVARSGTLSVGVPSGWSASPVTISYSLAGGAWQQFSVTINSASSAARGTSYPVTVTAPGISARASIAVASTDIILTVYSPWPQYTQVGAWLTSGLAGWNGTRSLYSAPGALGGSATWQPALPAAGSYEVAVWYPTNPDTTTAATYVVHHSGGDTTLSVNQQQDANAFHVLGTFTFDAGSAGYVRIEVQSPGYHRISAARFRPAPTA